MLKFKNIFSKKCSVIGMVHVESLPGTPLFSGSVDNIVSKACKETEIYLQNDINLVCVQINICSSNNKSDQAPESISKRLMNKHTKGDGIMVENMHDVPYIQSKYFGPEVTATMSRICTELRKIIPKTKPFGIQILAGGNTEALAVAKTCSMNFIRAEGFVFSHVADEGFTDANAGLILRYRKNIQAEDVLVFTDIKKKHSSHAITNDISLIETAQAADFFLSDGIVLTGRSTGDPTNTNDLSELKSYTSLPVLVGSGVTLENVQDYISADALIIGSYFKQNGKWNNTLNELRIRDFMRKIQNYY